MKTSCLVSADSSPGPRLVSKQPLWKMPSWMERYRSFLVNPAKPYPISVENLMNTEPLDEEMKERQKYVSVQITLLCRMHEEGYV